jgi:uncharacterized membrane protein YkvA (DUF1232 family)
MLINKLKQLARKLKSNLIVLYLSYRDQRVSWFAKIFTIFVVAYAFSPIDLIPDFIPILGYLDDLIIVPLGIYLALKMIPQTVLNDYKVQAEERMNQRKPRNWFTGTLFIVIWLSLAIWISLLFYRKFFD